MREKIQRTVTLDQRQTKVGTVYFDRFQLRNRQSDVFYGDQVGTVSRNPSPGYLF